MIAQVLFFDIFFEKDPHLNVVELAKRTQSGVVLRDKAFEIASDPKYDGY